MWINVGRYQPIVTKSYNLDSVSRWVHPLWIINLTLKLVTLKFSSDSRIMQGLNESDFQRSCEDLHQQSRRIIHNS